MNRRMPVAALALALTLLAPAVAHAGAHISWTDARITVTTDGAGDVISLSTRTFVVGGEDVVLPAFATDGSITYSPDAASAPNGCTDQIDTSYVICDPTDSFLFQGGGGNDTFSISDEPALNPLPLTANGNGGNDNLKDFSPGNRTLDGGFGNDIMFGSAGNDTLRGGPGNEDIDGGAGNDNVNGGEGDDKLFGDHFEAMGNDVIDGGPGQDRVIDDYPAGQGAVRVSLNGAADDGRAGEQDNLISIEEIEGPSGTYVGSDAAETFTVGTAEEASSVSGGGGNDTITTGNGADTVDGGPGDDRITAGFNNDTVTGGPGRDAIFSDATGNFCGFFSCTVPFGNDTVNARDGEPDSIDCGVGADRSVTDGIDTVANCETNDKTGPDDGDGGGSALTVLTKRSIRQIAARGLRIRVSCPAKCTIRGRLLTDKKLARRLRLGRSRQLASGRKTLRAAGTTTVTLKVAKKAKKRFRRLRKATVTLRVTRTGVPTVSRKLKLKR
jgi:hypothetical protein